MTRRQPPPRRLYDPADQDGHPSPRLRRRRCRRGSSAASTRMPTSRRFPRAAARRPPSWLVAKVGVARPLSRLVGGIGAGLLVGAALTTAAPGLAVAAVFAVAAWPITVRVVRRRAAARRLAVRREAAPAVLDLLGAALKAGLNPHKAVLRVAERAPAVLREALAARAEALRTRARLNAEAEAGRAAVRLAFPLVLCFLPAFVLLTVVPTVAGSLRALTP
jgi:tight adherence protein B